MEESAKEVIAAVIGTALVSGMVIGQVALKLLEKLLPSRSVFDPAPLIKVQEKGIDAVNKVATQNADAHARLVDILSKLSLAQHDTASQLTHVAEINKAQTLALKDLEKVASVTLALVERLNGKDKK